MKLGGMDSSAEFIRSWHSHCGHLFTWCQFIHLLFVSYGLHVAVKANVRWFFYYYLCWICDTAKVHSFIIFSVLEGIPETWGLLNPTILAVVFVLCKSRRLRWSTALVVSMLASGTRVRGFKPGRIRWIFRASEKFSACLPSEGK